MRLPRILIALIALATLMGANAPRQQDLPKGWRITTQNELTDNVRRESPTRYSTAEGDFNGDGVMDSAFLLRRASRANEGLWVYLSQADGSFRWVKLQDYPATSGSDSGMGIASSKPGVHSYGCFCDANECNLGKVRPKLQLRDPAIELFKIESAASMYFWSRSQEKFLCVVLSD